MKVIPVFLIQLALCWGTISLWSAESNDDEWSELDETFEILAEIESLFAPIEPPRVEFKQFGRLAAGLGFNNNIYQSPTSTKSWFTDINGDWVLDIKPSSPWHHQLYTFAQWQGYERSLTISDEWTALGFWKSVYKSLPWIYSTQFQYYYGDQFFDGGLNDLDIPTGARVIQHSAEWKTSASYELNSQLQVTGSIFAKFAELNFSTYNRQSYGTELEIQWTSPTASKAFLALNGEFETTHRPNDFAKDRFGIAASQESFETDSLTFSFLTGIPVSTPWGSSLIKGGLSWKGVDDNGGGYDDYWQFSQSIRLESKIKDLEFSISYQNSFRDYSNRRFSFRNVVSLEETLETVEVLLIYPVGKNTEIEFSAWSEDLLSNNNSDNFSNMQFSLLINRLF